MREHKLFTAFVLYSYTCSYMCSCTCNQCMYIWYTALFSGSCRNDQAVFITAIVGYKPRIKWLGQFSRISQEPASMTMQGVADERG